MWRQKRMSTLGPSQVYSEWCSSLGFSPFEASVMRLFEPFASNPVRSHAVRPRFPGERRGERHMLPTASRPTQGLPEFVARVDSGVSGVWVFVPGVCGGEGTLEKHRAVANYRPTDLHR